MILKRVHSDFLDLLFLLHSSKAFAAVYGSVVRRLEGNESGTTALMTGGFEEFLLGLAYVFALITARLASLGLVLEALFSIEFLFSCGEYEIVATVFALQCDVLIHVSLPRFGFCLLKVFCTFETGLFRFAPGLTKLAADAIQRIVHRFWVCRKLFGDFLVGIILQTQGQYLLFIAG